LGSGEGAIAPHEEHAARTEEEKKDEMGERRRLRTMTAMWSGSLREERAELADKLQPMSSYHVFPFFPLNSVWFGVNEGWDGINPGLTPSLIF
jgi:hypothetical protein